MKLYPPGYIKLSEAIDLAGTAWNPDEWPDCVLTEAEMRTLLQHVEAQNLVAKAAKRRQADPLPPPQTQPPDVNDETAARETILGNGLMERYKRRKAGIGGVWARLRQELAEGRLQAECFYASGESKLVPSFVWLSELNANAHQSNIVWMTDGVHRGGEPIFQDNFLANGSHAVKQPAANNVDLSAALAKDTTTLTPAQKAIAQAISQLWPAGIPDAMRAAKRDELIIKHVMANGGMTAARSIQSYIRKTRADIA